MQVPVQLDQCRSQLDDGQQVHVTPRELLSWFGVYRRTWQQVKTVNKALAIKKLCTVPDFEGAGFDEQISIQAVSATQSNPIVARPPDAVTTVSTITSTSISVDPIHRVSRFLPNHVPVSVTRNEPVRAAVTKMLIHDYSQLPVMQSEFTVAGMISWKSIGKQRALGNSCEIIQECMEPHFEVKGDDSIFDAIRVIQAHDCVLVRSRANRIIGILTATDISGSFEQLSRPFLLLSYIENHLRLLIANKFTVEELRIAKDPSDTERIIEDVSDLTFGEYVRFLSNQDNWSKLSINLDRNLFIAELSEIQRTRNGVMHFNPEGIEARDLDRLVRFSDFIEAITRTQVAI